MTREGKRAEEERKGKENKIQERIDKRVQKETIGIAITCHHKKRGLNGQNEDKLPGAVLSSP